MKHLQTNAPKISIVIPVKNGMDTLQKFIDGIKLQTEFDNCEVVVIDSGSHDGSIDFLSQFDFVNIISIDPKTFNHGDTRNLAVSHCTGDFVFMTVQDAWTTDPKLLERMLGHFEDQEVMGVVGHQVVPQEKGMNPHQWFRPQSKPSVRPVQFKNPQDFQDLSPKEQFSYCGWDDVIAMYRKSALQKLPFVRTDFAEDLIWAKNALGKGWKLIYDHRNRVFHYHHSYPDYVYKRTFIVLYSVYKSFGYARDLSVPLNSYIKIIYRNFKWKAIPSWIRFNIKAINARQKAYLDFKSALGKGESELDKAYKIACGEIPQGKSFKS